MNDVLYHKAMALCNLPYEKVRLTGTSADGYLYQLIADRSADWVINIDEDAFVSDVEALKRLIAYCIENNYTNCGMPDGGVVHLRDGNPLVTNPYFNIFNTKVIRELFSKDNITGTPDRSRFTQAELLVGPHNFDNTNEEPYYPFFIWTSNHFKTLYLKATNHPDGESTVLYNHLDEPFLIHTWYSRFYNHDRFHTHRIDEAFLEACKKQQIKINSPIGDRFECFYLRTRNKLVQAGIKLKKMIVKG